VLRQREMLRIAWRDLACGASVEQTLLEASAFAEAAIACATEWSQSLLAVRHGIPQGPDAGLIVLGMGKLGGGELNFSSDVDLVFLHAPCADSDGAVPLSATEFYLRQARTLIRVLDARTDAGFVFRVDMRLRPYGDSGPLVASFAAFEDYLQADGRDWERYAYVKARALTGSAAFETVREQVLRPFVYRRYLDFGVFDSLREMRALIAREVARRDLADHVKLGPGGIREVEFTVQSLQLIRGGQDPSLRGTSLLAVLPRLRGAKLLGDEAITQLRAAYLFLRRLENRLQMLDDQQTHSLPTESVAALRIARAMGFADDAALRAALDVHRLNVRRHAESVVVPAAAGDASAALDLAGLWDAQVDQVALRRGLAQLHLPDDEAVLQMLLALPGSARLRRLDAIGRRRLLSLLTRLLAELPAADALPVLRRLLSIIEAIGQRSAYFSLLLENERARRRLITVCSRGDFLASRVAAYPLLLDELIDEGVFHELPDRGTMAADLVSRVAAVAGEDPDRQVEALIQFQRAAVFRVALADLTGRLPLMQVSDRLTEIAELITEAAMGMAWSQIAATLGQPTCCDVPDAASRIVRVAAIGYGKLGGRELGYASDLDLVFLHDSAGTLQQTDAAEPVDNQVFFLRWAQRLLHLLTVHSAAGRLYEVDVRLRPSGKGGLLVTRIEAFRSYQFEEAWTWEHQALLHARAVAGDLALQQRIEAVRLEVLQDAVRREDLRDKVRDMRERMRRELSEAAAGQVDLKQDRGGIADIEFLAQYWALRWARQYPPLVWFPDTIRQLESLASAALVPQEEVDVLVSAYQAYRLVLHRRSLDGLGGVLDGDAFVSERAAVAVLWEAAMQGPVGL
jgi:glutamate-ammonia-ligase adenylyltransferase